jgi:hypothetical protein
MADKTIDERNKLLRYQICEMSEWAERGRDARKYYHGHQWDDVVTEGRERIQYTASGIRRTLDQMKGRVADGKPEMSAQGRGAEDFELGSGWRDLVKWADDWTGDRYDTVAEVRDKCWDDFFQVGEGAEKNTWNVDEESGMGMVVSEHVDTFRLAYDGNAKSLQRRDAAWICQYEPVDIELLETEFPKLKNKITSDVPDFFLEGFDDGQREAYESLRANRASFGAHDRNPQAYRREWWEKRPVKRKNYILNGRPAVAEIDGETIEMDDEAFKELTEEQQDLYEVIEYTDYELWVGVMVNDMWAIKMEMSEYDESKGGSGQYPYSFYSNVWDADWSHYHGEVEYMRGKQDALNQAMSAWLEQLFINNAQHLEVEKGAYPSGDLAKLENRGRRPGQVVFKHPGTKSAEWIGANPTSGQVFQSGLALLQQDRDDEGGYQAVNRGVAERDLSGKAVRALQSEADLLSVNQRLHLESGLRQAYWLRIALLQQFFRGSRMVRIVPEMGESGKEPYNLYVGESEERVKTRFGLSGEGEAMKDREGAAAQTLEISDDSIRKFDLKLQLGSGRDKGREEREELVKLMISYMGPGAGPGVIEWAADILEAPNREKLGEELAKADAQAKVVAQVKQIEEQTGMGLQDLAQVAMQIAQGGAQGPPQGQPPGGTPPGPQGPPQGAPQ